MSTRQIKNKVGIFSVSLVSLITSVCSFALAESNFPVRPIEVMRTSTPGTGADLLFTPLKDLVSQVLGQPIVVSYKPGSSGAIATAFVARAKADGYTLLFANKGAMINNPLTLAGFLNC